MSRSPGWFVKLWKYNWQLQSVQTVMYFLTSNYSGLSGKGKFFAQIRAERQLHLLKGMQCRIVWRRLRRRRARPLHYLRRKGRASVVVCSSGHWQTWKVTPRWIKEVEIIWCEHCFACVLSRYCYQIVESTWLLSVVPLLADVQTHIQTCMRVLDGEWHWTLSCFFLFFFFDVTKNDTNFKTNAITFSFFSVGVWPFP